MPVGTGSYCPMPEIGSSDIQGIVKLFVYLVFKMLLEEGMIAEKLVCNIAFMEAQRF